MSATASTRITIPAAGTSLRLRLAAVAVVIALAGLAAYTMFSGPTRVPLGPSKVAPRTTAPPALPPRQREPDREGPPSD